MKISKTTRRAATTTLAIALVAATLSCGGAGDLDNPLDMPHQANADVDWRDQVIYQIVVDRFEDGAP